jgi:hypothetical protein
MLFTRPEESLIKSYRKLIASSIKCHYENA